MAWRPGMPVLASLAGVILLVVALYLPAAAFHFLPPGLTGEADRLAELLALRPGQALAEIGAGTGALTVELARRVGPDGRVFSTELSAERREDIRARVVRERLVNVTVIEAEETRTMLPDACCTAVFMRNVYHHVGDTGAFNESLHRAVRDGGLLAIIDFEPGAFWRVPGLARFGVSAPRSSHGVTRAAVIAELGQAGFRVEREIEDWGGRMFLVLFRASARPGAQSTARAAM